MVEGSMNIVDTKCFVVYSLPNEVKYQLSFAEFELIDFTTPYLEHYDFIFTDAFKNRDKSYGLRFTDSYTNKPFSFTTSLKYKGKTITKDDYLHAVKSIITEIEDTELGKLVYSRTRFISDDGTDLALIFEELNKSYPTAFTYMINIPGVACWIGASPEILLAKESNNWITHALAGTQKKQSNVADVEWRAKEIEEHAFIEQFVTEICNDLQLSYTKTEKRTVEAGPVVHIKSDFRIQATDKVNLLIDKLHPGPAISGFPKSLAIEKIKNFESHERSFYTGIIGPTKHNDTPYLFINLRCMAAYKNGFELFIGGGLTKDSDPEAEWNETEYKSQTLIRSISQSRLNTVKV